MKPVGLRLTVVTKIVQTNKQTYRQRMHLNAY